MKYAFVLPMLQALGYDVFTDAETKKGREVGCTLVRHGRLSFRTGAASPASLSWRIGSESLPEIVEEG